MFILFTHYWKEQLRTFYWKKSWLVLLFSTLIKLYFAANFLIVGFFSDVIIKELFPSQSLVEMHFQFLFYYWLIDLFFRFKFQEVKLLQSKPYFTLPISRSKLDKFPLIQSLFSNYNCIYCLLLVPFFFRYVLQNESVVFSIMWWIIVLSGMLFVSFSSLYLRLFFQKKPLFGLIFLVVFLAGIAMEFKGYFSMSSSLNFIVQLSEKYLFPVLIFPLFSLLAYWVVLRFIKKLKYFEFESEQMNLKVTRFSFLERWGELGQHLLLDIKFLYRNKRTRAALVSCLIFPGWYFMMVTPKLNLTSSKHVFAGIFTIAQLCISYGQFVFAGHSTYFDGLMTQRLSMYQFIRAKYFLFVISMLLIYGVLLFFYFLNPVLPLINLSLLVFSIGTMPYLVLIVACYRVQRFEITQKSSFNYQGFSFLSLVPVAVVSTFAILVFNAFSLFDGVKYAYYTYFIVGSVGIVSYKWWLKSITRKFEEQKYKLAEGFREK